jgi:hypothetical protein
MDDGEFCRSAPRGLEELDDVPCRVDQEDL